MQQIIECVPNFSEGRNQNIIRQITDEVETVEEVKDSGFLITIVGYCPYGTKVTEVRNWLDPSNVNNTNKSQWGFITRLEYLDQLYKEYIDTRPDVNCPFELYDKVNSKNYDLKVEKIDIKGDYPVGTGIEEKKTYTTSFGGYTQSQNTDIPLVDPLTKEVISVDSEIDQSGKTVDKVNDHYFILKLKILWKNAPKPPEPNI